MDQSSSETIKFGILTAILAMFFDAAVGHGMFWQNDPFWSYWFVDAFLIATIVSAGTSILGIGIWQGPVLMVVQVFALEIYYQFLSPVGLPREPQWLSRFEIWTSGLPIHYLTYLSAFFLALWIWRRRNHLKEAMENVPPKRIALFSFIAAIIIIALDGFITQGFFLGYFAGFTFLLHRFVLSFVFLFFWSSYVGYDAKGLFSGALILSLVWLAFNMYLGALGLPTKFPFFLSHDDLWFKIFPGAFISSLVGLLVVRKFMPPEVKPS